MRRDALLGGGGSTLLGESCLDALRTLEGKYDLTESEKRMMAQALHRQPKPTRRPISVSPQPCAAAAIKCCSAH